ncbi:hypothetical protein MIR68_010185 [Amoeboaphelidium protococcarum]|nr:hypothetical protein MIR68_010185 [Amoeboaphelidium protococcarum]
MDPRFRKQKKNNIKVAVDGRFKSLLDDSEFDSIDVNGIGVSESVESRRVVDKYGRSLKSNRIRKDQISTRQRSGIIGKLYELGQQQSEETNAPADVQGVIEDGDDVESPAVDLARGIGIASDSDSNSDSDIQQQGEESSISDLDGNSEDDGDFDVVQMSKDAVDSDAGDDSEEVVDEMEILDQVPDRVPIMEDATPRLALVNVDWENLNSHDIMRIMNAFKPAGGSVLKVAVYKSSFGKQRLAEEELYGPPKEIFNTSQIGKADDDQSDNDEEYQSEDLENQLPSDGQNDKLLQNSSHEETFNVVALRKYQLERLRYYYAIITCDSKETSSAIYQECDQLEFEHSTTQLDLRFVPEEEQFNEDDIRDQCSFEDFDQANQKNSRSIITELRNKANQTNYLGFSAVKCSWDDDAPERKVMKKKWTKEELQQIDFNTYLASDVSLSTSSSSSGEEGDTDLSDESDAEDLQEDVLKSGQVNDSNSQASNSIIKQNKNKKNNKWSKKEAMRSKYLSLLQGGGSDSDSNADGNGSDGSMQEEMEISFAPGLSDVAQRLLDSKKLREQQQGETVFEKYLREKSEKRKELKKQKKSLWIADNGRKDVEYDVDDDDIPAEYRDDAFFKQDIYGADFDAPGHQISAGGPMSGQKSNKTSKKRKSDQKDASNNNNNNTDLELLMLDERFDGNQQEDSEEDFSYRKSKKGNKKKLKQKKLKGSNDQSSQQPPYEIDDRFKALRDNPEYALDPTSSKFQEMKKALK